jgi:spore maturation protein CgeB
MNIVYFMHSLVSCWNHGNAHFLRGVVRELLARGHDVRVFEPQDGWSRTHLLQEQGPVSLDLFRARFPELRSVCFGEDADLNEMVDGTDLVLVHEWTEPAMVAKLNQIRKHGGKFLLFFHDTHHRAVSDPEALTQYDITAFDGVLAFGAALRDVYSRAGWGERAFVWHEAADTKLFHPLYEPGERDGLVWIGNWGDDERSKELQSFLLEPVASLGVSLDMYGVRYPPSALALAEQHGARYRGWLPNCEVPTVFSRHRATVHIPRRFYAGELPGIPTIRVFEALACGIPLVCSPWDDVEGLFEPGQDFLMARNAAEMTQHLLALMSDGAMRENQVAHGLSTVLSRHTCSHRVDELLQIVERVGGRAI